ncbi:hypothetical protein Rifp1Sym_cd00180 [endosymbiont of Riftia pachyptila (vent Ph05)]|jgi:hypothetical protein|uniref:Uncharacterized protein n=2 Tax=sulfur-oxidizing symbionts TaxID=32036 RepID=G2FBJ0_9GAMM|nr:hypothetical protein Rifp1Sym_cd00180 [endosymbiont of Riftia pachyptila (vent Ph05)]EGW55671.1 hypothetical protein TevJSym_ab00230 [endosymbiont of Tevnia jerichonana (vent Tica)]
MIVESDSQKQGVLQRKGKILDGDPVFTRPIWSFYTNSQATL